MHVTGAFETTRAAWPIMRDQGYGRVIMTSSTAGVYGNFGQANYSAAKLALHGLTQTLAIEGKPKGVHANTIAPLAASALAATVMPDEVMAQLSPDWIAPLVLWLCHEDCTETGQLFEAGGGWFAKVQWMRSKGLYMEAEATPEAIVKNWDTLTDMRGAEEPKDAVSSMAAIFANK